MNTNMKNKNCSLDSIELSHVIRQRIFKESLFHPTTVWTGASVQLFPFVKLVIKTVCSFGRSLLIQIQMPFVDLKPMNKSH